MREPIFIVVDLFCGAGGTTTGFVQAASGMAKVIACVNHDPKAIKSHWRNHPEVKHFEEDIRTLDLTELAALVRFYRNKYPDAYLILWASLECTNFSKAKGGQSRNADSRTLADHLDRYVVALDPDYIQIENVVEFMSWGPLDENGKPISRKNGLDWMRWREMICSHGYRDDWKELNSANFGAYTSRNRLFGVFARHGLPIVWPDPTHAKKTEKHSLYGNPLKKWNAVKEVLDLEDEGESIFNRKKPLVDKTLERIYAGLVKYVAKGDKSFLSKYFSGRPKGKVNSVNDPGPTVTTFGGSALVQAKNFSDLSIDGPAGAITTIDHHALVNASFISKYYSGNPGNKNVSIDEPAPTIRTKDGQALIQCQFLTHYYGSGGEHSSVNDPCPTITAMDGKAIIRPEYLINYNHSSDINGIDEPAPTLVTKDKLAKIKPEHFIDQQYGNSKPGSIETVAGAITANPKQALVACNRLLMPTNFDNQPKSVEDPAPTITADRHHTYIVNPSHGGFSTSTDAPCPVIIARQDKAPLYLVAAIKGMYVIPVYEDDSEPMIRIKQFMAAYGLIDIKMRMLRVSELLQIQGFPDGYILEGNQADQKKFIGNSVVPDVVKAWTEAMGAELINNDRKIA